MHTFAPKQVVLQNMAFFITCQDRQTQVAAADAMATTTIID